MHRPKYDDWSWAKGKLDPGEDWPVAAVRETHEETSLEVRLGRPLPPAAYTVLNGSGEPTLKEVRYWASEVIGGDGRPRHEIDEVRWLDVVSASDRLDYARDRDQLRALVRSDKRGALTTWPLALIRHGHAEPRGSWRGDDQLRPLNANGRQQADAIGALLAAYGIRRLLSSPSVRCADTLQPYASSRDVPLRLKEGLSEEGYAAKPGRASHHLRRLLDRGTPAALCSHGPVLPDLLEMLIKRVDPSEADSEATRAALERAAEAKMGKGEVLVAHLVGTGEECRVVAAERHAS